MDFTIPDSILRLVERARRELVDRELIPRERELLARPFGESLPLFAELREKARALGLWAPHMPRALGGAGLSLIEFAHLSEALGRTPFGHYVCNCQAPDVGNMELLAHFGSDAQKARWLAPLVEGRLRSCFSMTEPELPGSNPTWLGTTAVLDGDHFVINGHKWFTSSAEGAAFAVVMAVTDPDAEPHRRASQLIVPLDTPGIELVRNIPVMGERGSDWASHAEIVYRDVRVDRESALLGRQGAGFELAQARLGPGRIHHCMRWIGIAERALELMASRAASRRLTPDEVLGDKQTVQNWLAESRAEIDAARLMVLRTAWLIDRQGQKAARQEVSIIKFFVANMLQRVLDRAIQAHGALGMTDDLPLAWWFRHERAARIYDGADEVHKAVVARRILRGARGD